MYNLLSISLCRVNHLDLVLTLQSSYKTLTRLIYQECVNIEIDILSSILIFVKSSALSGLIMSRSSRVQILQIQIQIMQILQMSRSSRVQILLKVKDLDSLDSSLGFQRISLGYEFKTNIWYLCFFRRNATHCISPYAIVVCVCMPRLWTPGKRFEIETYFFKLRGITPDIICNHFTRWLHKSTLFSSTE